MNASQQIDHYIASLNDWRGELLATLRTIVNGADPGLTEAWKWNTPVWTNNGNVCALGAFKNHVKINFFKGAHLDDPEGLFNAGLDAKASRGIDLQEGDVVNEVALKDLVRSAAALNNP